MQPHELDGLALARVEIELVQQFLRQVPDWIAIPGANLGNTSALGAGFELTSLGLITKPQRI